MPSPAAGPMTRDAALQALQEQIDRLTRRLLQPGGLVIVSETEPVDPPIGQLWLSTAAPGIYDDFNRPPSSTTLGTSSSGHTWIPLAGTWGIINGGSDGVANQITGSTQAYAVIDTGLADCTVAVNADTSPINGGGLTWRAADANNLWFWDIDSSGPGGTPGGSVYKVVAGSFTQVLTGLPDANHKRMSVDLNGSAMDILIDGVVVDSITDSFNATETQHGIRDYGGACELDDFSINDAGGTAKLKVWDGTQWLLIADPVLPA